MVLLLSLQDDKASDAKDVIASQADRPPRNAETYWAEMIVELRDGFKNFFRDGKARGFCQIVRQEWGLEELARNR